MNTLKSWMETVYREQGIGAAIAVAVIVAALVLGIAHIAGYDARAVWEYLLGVLD